jgi:hypothetical protein
MILRRERQMRGFLAAASLLAIGVLGFGAAGQAQIWGPTAWSDDFEDGNYTSNPTWSVAGDPYMMASRGVVSWEGDYAFQLTAPYVDPLGAGWSLAYAGDVEGDQGMLTWVDTSTLASDDWATVCLLRYSPPAMAFGTGYAVVVLHGTADAIAVALYQINETGYTPITDPPVVVSATYTDVWVRFVAFGTDAATTLAARVWPAGQAEPSGWTLDSNVPGSGSGITTYYNTGRGGVGTVALASGVSGTAYFDDVEFAEEVLCAEPPW